MRNPRSPLPAGDLSRSRPIPPGRLLDAARELVIREGLGVSMERIAAAAGVTRVTLYRHFGSRDDLLAALLVHESRQLAGDVKPILDDTTRPFADRLVDLLAMIVPAVRRSVFFAKFLGERPVGRLTGPQLHPFGDELIRFFLPYFVDGANRTALRHDPARTLDWLFRVVLLELVAPPPAGGAGALVEEVESFVLPGILTSAALAGYRRRHAGLQGCGPER